MNVVTRRRMTVDEFLAWEDRQETKHEFDGVRPVAMVDVTRAHGVIHRNLMFALTARLRGKPCEPFGSDFRLRLARTIRYADAIVVCTPGANNSREVTDPVVVFEILSESTAETDLGPKNCEYRDTPSVQRYVILRQDAPATLVFARRNGGWFGSLHGHAESLDMPEIGIDVPVAAFYEGLTFDQDAAAQE